MNPQFKKGILDLCVLSLISRKDRYGYELVEEISKKFEISEGTIYPILRRLTDENYFDTYIQESSEGPARKYYRITAHGKKHYNQLSKDWTVFQSQLNDILSKG